MTAMQPSTLSKQDARDLVRRISYKSESLWDDVVLAYFGRAWVALGYDSWDELCQGEFANLRIRLPREAQQEVTASLRESGMSTRAIAAATGTSKSQVADDLSSVRNRTLAPANVVGINGKNYTPRFPRPERTAQEWQAEAANRGIAYVQAQRHGQPDEPLDAEIVEDEPAPIAPRRRPITDQASDAVYELRKAADKLARITSDDRFGRNRDQLRQTTEAELNLTAAALQDFLAAVWGENAAPGNWLRGGAETTSEQQGV